jgi:TetR/AcrR family hemagglutinin/protease transcriptional regulator
MVVKKVTGATATVKPATGGKKTASKTTASKLALSAATTAAPVKAARMRATRMSPEARRAQLLQCALNIFAEKGLGEANHTDLAEAAGVSVPTTFHYFPTREELSAVVIGEVTRFLLEDFVESRIATEVETGSAAIGSMLLAFADAIDTHPDHVRVWLQLSSAVRDGYWQDYLAFYINVLRRIKVLLLRGLRDGSIHPELDVDAASRIIVGCAHMVAHLKFGDGSREIIEQTVHSLVRGYLEGYRPRP